MLTEKDYCDYDTCVALNELGLSFEDASQGFERNILTNRYEEVPRPLLYEAQKWLREEKHLHIEVRWYCNMWYEYEVKEAEGKVLAEGSAFKTYEEALSTAIYMATEHLKEEKL